MNDSATSSSDFADYSDAAGGETSHCFAVGDSRMLHARLARRAGEP
jgi:hypothetical protein